MEKKTLLLIIIVTTLLLIGLATTHMFLDKKTSQFYVGVTYGGNSVQEAKELIDQVKGYTNLFILASGTIQNATAVEEIGDYAVASGLKFAVYNSENVNYANSTGTGINKWANAAKERWKDHFIGVYYRDEPGGEMLDGKTITLEETTTKQNGEIIITQKVSKSERTIITYTTDNHREDRIFSSTTTYEYSGKIVIRNTFNNLNYQYCKVYDLISSSENSVIVDNPNAPSIDSALAETIIEDINYYPNGTITIQEYKTGKNYNFYTIENITKYPWPLLTYEKALEQKPIQTYDDAANTFVHMNKRYLTDINKKQLNKESITVFTADYSLYWWNYQSGYDVVLAELGWNNSITQEICLVRGAANAHNKPWGTILTWKYTNPPYLTSGEETFEQLRTAYQTGAQYAIVFNYSENHTNPNTLQEEHFLALKRFWEEVVQNPDVVHGEIKAEAVLILPKNYGWGLRNSNDHIWGLWPTDEKSQEIWNQIQNKINQHGLKLDIVFEDSNYSLWNYNHVYYGNKK